MCSFLLKIPQGPFGILKYSVGIFFWQSQDSVDSFALVDDSSTGVLQFLTFFFFGFFRFQALLLGKVCVVYFRETCSFQKFGGESRDSEDSRGIIRRRSVAFVRIQYNCVT